MWRNEGVKPLKRGHFGGKRSDDDTCPLLTGLL